MTQRQAVTLTSKGQVTLPVALVRQLGLQRGTKIDIYFLPKRAGFSAVIRRPSRILDFAGDLRQHKEGTGR